jgi:hypothetical protein
LANFSAFYQCFKFSATDAHALLLPTHPILTPAPLVINLPQPFPPHTQVLVPTSEFIQKLTAARLAADVADVPTLIIARTDALGAFLLTSDIDDRDKPFCTGTYAWPSQPWL